MDYLMNDNDDDIILLAGEIYEKNQKKHAPLPSTSAILCNKNEKKNVFKAPLPPTSARRGVQTTVKNFFKPSLHSRKNTKNKFLQGIIERRKKQLSLNNLNFLNDVFFCVEQWPAYLQQIILSSDFNHASRLKLAAFFVGNGLIEPEVAEIIFKIWNRFWSNNQLWRDRFRQFKNLFAYLNRPIGDPERIRIRSTYFYYCMRYDSTFYLNGVKK